MYLDNDCLLYEYYKKQIPLNFTKQKGVNFGILQV